MFDLPVETTIERTAYAKFRKFLIKSGFIMIQESVYSKLCLNATAAKSIFNNIREHSPSKGLVQMMMVTEKQYANIEYFVGSASNEYITSTERLVVL